MAEEKTWTKEKLKTRIDEKELDLSLCSIVKVPIRGILGFPQIISIDLSCNRISTLPDQFCQLINLVQLDLSKNQLVELPEEIGAMTRLKKLDLLSNRLTQLPLSFSQLKSLQWLDLKGNPMQELHPEIVGDCLKPAECRSCATNIVRYMQEKHDQHQIELARETKREMEQQSAREKEEEKLRFRKREDKKRRKEEYEKNKRLKEMGMQAMDTSEFTEDSLDGSDTVISQADSTTDPSSSCAYQCFKIFLCLAVLLSVLLLACLFVFDGDVTAMRVRAEAEALALSERAFEVYERAQAALMNQQKADPLPN